MSGSSRKAGIVAPTPGDSEGDSGHIATRMMVNILLQFHHEVHVFARATAVFEFDDERVYVHRYTKPYPQSPWYLRLPGQLIYQLKFAIGIIKQSMGLGLVIFGGGGFVIPAIASKLCFIHVFYRIGGVTYKEVPRQTFRQYIWSQFLKTFWKLQYFVSDTILVMSPSLIEFADLGIFSNKCRVWNHYYFDLELFNENVDYNQRKPVLGHIGVSETKGTMQLLKAFEETDISDHYTLVILGDGPQLNSAKKYNKNRNINVKFTGYVDRTELPQQYNQMQLFINCSKSEGVPKAMFEAMACGTPVAATPVGGVPDYISDRKNGFLLTSNSPESLAEEIDEIVKQDKREIVTERCRKFVFDNFSYQSTVDRYYEIVSEETTIDISESPDDPVEPINRI